MFGDQLAGVGLLILDSRAASFDRLNKRALAFIEPFLLITVALVIGVIVVSLYLPLFNIPKIVGKG